MRSTASNTRALDHPRINYSRAGHSQPRPPPKKEKVEWVVWGCGFPPLKRWERRASGHRTVPIGFLLQNTKKSRQVAGFAKTICTGGVLCSAPPVADERTHESGLFLPKKLDDVLLGDNGRFAAIHVLDRNGQVMSLVFAEH